MSLIATLHYPDLNPLGLPSLLAACISILLGAAIVWTSRRSVVSCSIITAAAPALLLACSDFVEGSWLQRGRCFPDADDYAAEIVLLVFAFAFAMENLRFATRFHQFNAAVFTGICGIILAFDAGNRIRVLHLRRLPMWNDPPWWGYVAVTIFLVCWILAYSVLRRRAIARKREAAGLCPFCGYNLTGNISGVCPECGHPARLPTSHEVGSTMHG